VLAPPANIPQFAPDYYRPLVIASYLLDQSIGGGQPGWFHFTVLLAHVLATLAVFALGDALFRRAADLSSERAAWAAALGAAVFAVHPIHTEAVAWIAGRADVFAGLFGVTAVWAHLRSRSQALFAWVAGVAWLLALFS
jgi:protein O-mannosyl-transferase